MKCIIKSILTDYLFLNDKIERLETLSSFEFDKYLRLETILTYLTNRYNFHYSEGKFLCH